MAGMLAGRAPADAVIVAAGGSRRMGGLDKLQAPVLGRPLLAWTIDAFASSPVIDRLVIVTAADRVAILASEPWLPTRAAVVRGGATRQQSVAAGVAHLDGADPDGGDRPVLIHDGARPLVSVALIDAVATAVGRHGAAIPVMPVSETVKRLDGGLVHETLDRSNLATAQTPQGARRTLLRKAWARYPPAGGPEFTDEAALLEACRIPVHAIPGEAANLKVTVPDDLSRVELALGSAAPRVGFGHDSHPFGPGYPLRLGGIEWPAVPRLAGHSDGDVVLHALADALLGAAGMGDLGRIFPADSRTPAGIASTDLLAEVVARVRAADLRPASVDVVVIAARPKLASRLDEMRDVIARALDLAPERVNVKASTGNLEGDEGAGRSIASRAVATLEGVR
jgi:2-C-methyl-D-erythritol 4-phosphate cytidylyltransferase / 2-C-methyl-D-erythritol 2,4-cyclodiphosphate synthase